MKKDLGLLNYLISMGAVTSINNSPDYEGTRLTPLSAAVRNHDLELVHSLLRAGANPYNIRALEEAANDFRLLQALLTAFPNYDKPINCKSLGLKALNKAIKNQDQEMIKAILDSPLRSISLIANAFYAALIYNTSLNLELVCLLLRFGADPKVVWQFDGSRISKSAIFVAIESNSPQKFQLLLEAGALADEGLSSRIEMPFGLIQLAVFKENRFIVQKLLEYGSNPNAVSPSQKPTPPTQIAVRKGDIEMVRILLQYNANPNVVPPTSGSYETPIMTAIRNQDTEMVRILLQYNTKLNIVFSEWDKTPLQMACEGGSKEMIELLLEHGADVNAPPAKIRGATAL
jgi:cytohesin